MADHMQGREKVINEETDRFVDDLILDDIVIIQLNDEFLCVCPSSFDNCVRMVESGEFPGREQGECRRVLC